MRNGTLWHATVALLILSPPWQVGAAIEQRGVTGSPSEVGIPVPGTASDQETTLKRRDPAKVQNPETDAQVTLGGAQTFIEGNISRIEGTYYFVKKDDSGDETRLIVNRDTNLDCAASPANPDRGSAETMTSERLTPKEEAPRASPQQLEQGQRVDETARGSGFRIGNCSFQAGDRIKAEVDDNGRVTTLKYMAAIPPKAPRGTGLSAGTGQLALAREEDRPADVDMTGGMGYPPKEYAVVPLRLGQLEPARDTDLIQAPIYDLQGHKVGTLDNLLVDRGTGHIEYAVILVEHTEHHLHPLPWSAIQLQRDPKGPTKMIVDTQKHKIHPDITTKDVEDLSPAVQQIVEQMTALRQREAKVAKKRPADPTVAGVMGEETVGGLGPSGTAGPPPGPAPGFEQEKDRP